MTTITCMFVDIVGWREFASEMEDHQIVSCLNKFYDTIVPFVLEQNGHLDKFTGDGIMAFWERSDEMERDAKRAAMKIRASSQFTVRVGIATDIAVLSCFGWRGRKDYSAVGPAVWKANEAKKIANPGKIVFYRNNVPHQVF